MKITSIELYKGKTYAVEIDIDKRIYLHENIIVDHKLKVEQEISIEKLKEVMRESDLRRAWERALYLLDYREHSYTDLYQKLERSYSSEVCYITLDKLVKLGMINDKRYAQNLASKYIETRRYGIYRASYEMQSKGLDKELVEEVLSAYEKNSAERLMILVGRKYSKYLTDQRGIQKVKSALVRQGYGYDDINAVIETYLDNMVKE